MNILNNLITIYLITFLTSFVSISYEIIVARLVSHFTQNYVLSQSITISFFILSLGIGSYCYTYIRDKSFISLIKIEMSILFIILFSVLSILSTHVLISQSNLGLHKNTLLIMLPQIWIFLIGFLAGMEIPFLLTILKNEEADKKFSYVLAISYFGSFVGSIITVNFLISRFGLINTIVILSNLTLISCILIIVKISQKIKYSIYCFIFFILNLIFFQSTNNIMQFYLKSYYYGIPVHYDFSNYLKMPDVRRISTPYQDIDLVKDQYKNNSENDHYLFIDLKLQYTSQSEKIYHESMVHGSLNLNKSKVKNILVLGAGDGLLIRELLKYDVNLIDLVEIDENMIKLAKNDPIFTLLNSNSLKNEKVHIHIEDAFIWLKYNKKKYDAIFVDFPHPFSIELSRLFSYEFYSFLNRSLENSGFIILDFPFNSLYLNLVKIYPQTELNVFTNTLIKAGFINLFIYGPKESFVFAKKNSTDIYFDEETLFPKVTPITYSNLVKIVNIKSTDEVSKPYNSIFKPYFLVR